MKSKSRKYSIFNLPNWEDSCKFMCHFIKQKLDKWWPMRKSAGCLACAQEFKNACHLENLVKHAVYPISPYLSTIYQNENYTAIAEYFSLLWLICWRFEVKFSYNKTNYNAYQRWQNNMINQLELKTKIRLHQYKWT